VEVVGYARLLLIGVGRGGERRRLASGRRCGISLMDDVLFAFVWLIVDWQALQL
jgi:hypothetical protein